MTPAQMRDKALAVVRALYATRDVNTQQKHYQYLRGLCDGWGVDFASTLLGARRALQRQCVGVLDSAKYR